MAAGTVLLLLLGGETAHWNANISISNGSLSRSMGTWYWRSGQWQADARTLVAAARWVLTPDLPNQASATNAAASVLADTNSIARRPAV